MLINKKIVLALVMLSASQSLRAAGLPVQDIPISEWKIGRVTATSNSTSSWKSDLVGTRQIVFENAGSIEMFMSTTSNVTSSATISFMLNTRNNPNSSLVIDGNDNDTWFFFAAGGTGDVRILYGR